MLFFPILAEFDSFETNLIFFIKQNFPPFAFDTCLALKRKLPLKSMDENASYKKILFNNISRTFSILNLIKPDIF